MAGIFAEVLGRLQHGLYEGLHGQDRGCISVGSNIQTMRVWGDDTNIHSEWW